MQLSYINYNKQLIFKTIIKLLIKMKYETHRFLLIQQKNKLIN